MLSPRPASGYRRAMRGIRYVAVGTSLVASLALAACGGGGSNVKTNSSNSGSSSANSPSPSGTAPANPAAATAEIKKLYGTFFSASPAKAATLLEDGSHLGKAIKVANKLANGGTESGKAKKVTFTGPTSAQVLYALSINHHVVLPNATGKAVLVNGKWVVAKTTFCGLVGLGEPGKKIPGC